VPKEIGNFCFMPDAPIKTVGIMSKPRTDRAVTLVPALVKWLAGRGIAVRVDEETAIYLGRRTDALSRQSVTQGAQLLIVLGGDGTLLAASRAALGVDIPLLAVNLGNLGFLTAITVEELYPQLERVLRGEYRMTRRRMLHVELWRDGKMRCAYEALNDMCVAKAEIARIIDLEMQIDDRSACVYKADGLIVCTPTGSTAYSLSAGGPIIFPTVAAHCITPICPHTLTHRPVIVPDDRVIKVILRSGNTTYLTVDGQAGELLAEGDEIVCRRSDHAVSLIQQPGMMFFDVLREKLQWGGR
jgi:NAD+ kinase